MVALVIETLFALLFLRAVGGYLRRRDPIQRDLAAVFAPFTLLLTLEIARRALNADKLPTLVMDVGVAALLAQPYLTLRLVATMRPVARSLMAGALAVAAGSTALMMIIGEREVPIVGLVIVVGFFAIQGVAAWLLASEARIRTGAPRARLALAAGATAVLGLCLLLAAGGSLNGALGRIVQIGSQVLALLSALSYIVAFLPPRWLRNTWSGHAAYQVHHRMVNQPANGPADVWQAYAEIVRDVTGASGAVVVLPDGAGTRCVARSGEAVAELEVPMVEVTHALAQLQPIDVDRAAGLGAVLREYAHTSQAKIITAVPLPVQSGPPGALILLNRRWPLFVDDDARLLGELGVQAAVLAERGATAEAIRSLNAELESRVQERTQALRAAQTALEDVNHQLEAQNTELARSNEELQRFAYVASHDLQEPLRKIISFSGLLLERAGPDLDPDMQMCVDRIVGSSHRMRALIEDLLRFSRAGGPAERQPVDCDLVLRTCLDALAVQISEADATITNDPLPTVLANRTRVEQVFQNLIGNALKYRSVAPPKIHIGATADDGMWRLTISDNGIGLDMAYAERVFQVFQRLHPRGRYEGTGIGLALCKRIVESYGGVIGVDSVPDQGSVFWLTLPGVVPVVPSGQEVSDVIVDRVG